MQSLVDEALTRLVPVLGASKEKFIMSHYVVQPQTEVRSTKQRNQRIPCFIPHIYEVLMVNLDCDEKLVTISSPEGLTFEASYIDLRTLESTREVVINTQPDVKIHFMQSEYPGWYYILQYSNYFSRYGCSCRKGKIYQQTNIACEHMVAMTAEGV
jgi:hypothetical protein